MSEIATESCIGCNARANFRCPTCSKLGIKNSFFCSQECFKSNWPRHKSVHSSKQKPNVFNPWPSYDFSGRLRPFPRTPLRDIPNHIMKPDYADHPLGASRCEAEASRDIVILNDEDIQEMRVAGRLGRQVLDEALDAVAVGVTTDEIDRIVHEACIARDCYPSPLNYRGFPKSTCTSVNECICHGIPDLRPLENGDILNVDVTVFHRGFHADLNETVLVGNVSPEAKKLVSTTHECLLKAIDFVRPGNRYRDVGNIIERHARASGLSVVRSYIGHGVHRLFHTMPNVPHYANNRAIGIMKAGHVFTIEPMINQGSWHDLSWPDNWTSVTVDGKLSAQFEETLLVTENGCEVLTARGNGLPHFSSQI